MSQSIPPGPWSDDEAHRAQSEQAQPPSYGYQQPGQPYQGQTQQPGQPYQGQAQQPGYQQPGYPQQGYQQPQYQGPIEPPLSPENDRLVGMFSHLLNIVALAIGPLILWLVLRKRGPLADSEGKEALNFGITVAIALTGLTIVSTVLGFILPFLALLLPIVYTGIAIAFLIFAILGAVQAYQGRPYRYPASFRFVT